MASRMHTTLINVRVEYADDGRCWVLSSKDLPGLLLAGCDIYALLADVPVAIKLLYKLNYQLEVEVAPAEDDGVGRRQEKSPLKPLPRSFVALRAA